MITTISLQRKAVSYTCDNVDWNQTRRRCEVTRNYQITLVSKLLYYRGRLHINNRLIACWSRSSKITASLHLCNSSFTHWLINNIAVHTRALLEKITHTQILRTICRLWKASVCYRSDVCWRFKSFGLLIRVNCWISTETVTTNVSKVRSEVFTDLLHGAEFFLTS